MELSKWYIVQGEDASGNYAYIKEEDTDNVVFFYPHIPHHEANERALLLTEIVGQHNKIVKLSNKKNKEMKEFNKTQELINNTPSDLKGRFSDGYHSFDELYEFRKVYNAVLFNEWHSQGKYNVHKSKKHADGEDCFGGCWFVVVAMLPDGQITNHYKEEDWDLFNVKETDKALFEFDGHTSQDVLFRLKNLK